MFLFQKDPDLKWQEVYPYDVEQKSMKSRVISSLDDSGQIIATSHDLTPNGGLVRENPLFQVFPGW